MNDKIVGGGVVLRIFGRIHPVHKIAAFILVLLMIFPLLPLPAMGANERTASLTSGEGHKGDTIRVNLIISDVKDIAGLEGTLSYDTTRLTTVSNKINRAEILKNFVYDNNVLEDKSYLKFTAASTEKIKQLGDAVLLTVDFVIKDNAPTGKAYVNLSNLLVTDDSSRLETNTIDGGIMVLASGGSGSSNNPSGGSSSTPLTPSATEEITVIVDTGDGLGVSTATIHRTTSADGTRIDEITFRADQAREAVNKAKASGRTTVRMVIPDPKDEVSQLDLTIPKDAVDELARGGMNLEIYTDNAKIVIPNHALQGLTDDLYFRFVPIKNQTQRTEVEERAKGEQVVREVGGDNRIKAVARPMTIETNLSNRTVDIVLPLLNIVLPTDKQERDAFLADLVIFIEHSDGERELMKPEVVEYKSGQLGLVFRITKFSTFTILNMEGWDEYIKAQETLNRHEAYMKGYPDLTFKPERSISRAEMATILSRIGGAGAALTDGKHMTFPDVASDHWASLAIRSASSKGLMAGFPDGTFKPEQSITRAEMATIVSHWLGLRGEATATFSDTVGHWAQQNIALVQQAGIIKGLPDGSFQPDKSLTRAEAVTMINKILKRGSQDWTTPGWSDVPTTHWAFKDIDEASVSHSFTTDPNGSEVVAAP